MDLALSPEQHAFREEVRAFLAASLSPELRRGAALTSGVFAEPDIAREWQAILEAKGWLIYHWPDHAGGPGWTPVQRWIFEKECAEAGAPVLPGMGLKLVGPVLYTYGTPAQKDHYLPRLRTAEHVWAQGFSEPGSGSDLASLRTRAVRDGDHYVVSGHKIWTTQAQYANRLFALVRTDPHVKPQQGISFLLIDMALPGVTVKPILSASGDHELNEVFLDEVRVPVSERVGQEGQGWSIAKFLLENERGGSSGQNRKVLRFMLSRRQRRVLGPSPTETGRNNTHDAPSAMELHRPTTVDAPTIGQPPGAVQRHRVGSDP